MKTLLPVLTLASAVIVTTAAFAADFSNDFVAGNISKHWELDTLEITQRIDVKKRREMKNKSVEIAEGNLQSFEAALKKLMQQSGGADIKEADIADIMSSFAQPGSDMQMLSVESDDTDNTDFPSADELMLTDVADYDATMMIEESLTLNADGSVVYATEEAEAGDDKQDLDAEEAAAAKWAFDEGEQQLIVTEQQDSLSISAAYKLIELSDKRMVLEQKQRDSSVRMIFSSK